MQRISGWTLGLRLLVALLSTPSLASNGGGMGGGPEGGMVGGNQSHRGGPPREAIEACSGKSSGAACSFSGRGGETVTGNCFSPKQDLPLGCRPEGGPPGGGAGGGQGGDSRNGSAGKREGVNY